MPEIEKQNVAGRGGKAKLTPKRLALLALKHQLEQRLLKKQHESFHTKSIGGPEDGVKEISIRWQVANIDNLQQLRSFIDKHLRKDWFERERVIRDKLLSNIILLGWHESVLICWASKGPNEVLQNLLVHPDYRGFGIGQQAMDFIGAYIIRSKSDQSTGDPEAFYNKNGFESTGIITGRKKNINLMVKR